MKIELLSVPDCPNAGPLRDLLRRCLEQARNAVRRWWERVGDFPSPTLLIKRSRRT